MKKALKALAAWWMPERDDGLDGTERDALLLARMHLAAALDRIPMQARKSMIAVEHALGVVDASIKASRRS